jgi:hypothetical protein
MKHKRLSLDVKQTRARLKLERANPGAGRPDQHFDALNAAVRYLQATSRNGRRWPTTFRYERARCIFGLKVTSFGRVFLTDKRTGQSIVGSRMFAV